MEKKKFQLEYILHSSISSLYNSISSPIGLSEWFADNVDTNGDIYTFKWEGSSQEARVLNQKKGDSIRFQWEEDNEPYYFELKISTDPLTKVVALLITDFAEEDEIEEAKMLWDTQIHDLKIRLGA